MNKISDQEKWAIISDSIADPGRRVPRREDAPEKFNEIGFGYIVEMVAQLSSDSAAEFLRNYDPSTREKILTELPEEQSRGIREILSYPLNTCGAIMTKEYLWVREDVRMDEAVDYLHGLSPERKARVPYIYAVNSEGILKGVLQIEDLIFQPKNMLVRDAMKPSVDHVSVLSRQNDAANIIQERNYAAVPVVDGAGKMSGIILPSNVIQMIRRQADKDIAKMLGTGVEELASPSVSKILRLRTPWLFVNIASGLVCAFIAGLFENVAELAVLFLFVPVVLGIAESTGVQGATIMVRNLSMKKFVFKEFRNLFLKEGTAGVVISLICGLAVGTAAYLWKQNWILGLAISFSMNVSVFIAAVIGLLLPVFFKLIRVDPAIASGPLVLAICDIQTLLVYFNLAGRILSQ